MSANPIAITKPIGDAIGTTKIALAILRVRECRREFKDARAAVVSWERLALSANSNLVNAELELNTLVAAATGARA